MKILFFDNGSPSEPCDFTDFNPDKAVEDAIQEIIRREALEQMGDEINEQTTTRTF